MDQLAARLESLYYTAASPIEPLNPLDSQSIENPPSYSPAQRRLHWWVAVLSLGQFAFQDLIHRAITVVEANGTPSASEFTVLTLHIWIGAAIAVMVLYRLYLRRSSPVPVAGGLVSDRSRASTVISMYHSVLYAAVLFMAGTGALNYYLDVSGAALWHRCGKWVFGALVLMHIAVAIWHWRFKKNQVLQRMLGTDTSSDPGSDH